MAGAAEQLTCASFMESSSTVAHWRSGHHLAVDNPWTRNEHHPSCAIATCKHVSLMGIKAVHTNKPASQNNWHHTRSSCQNMVHMVHMNTNFQHGILCGSLVTSPSTVARLAQKRNPTPDSTSAVTDMRTGSHRNHHVSWLAWSTLI